MARDDKVIIRLTPEIKEEFQQVAERLGLSLSGLGGYVIGSYLDNLRAEQRMKERTIDQMLPGLTEMARNKASEVSENLQKQFGR